MCEGGYRETHRVIRSVQTEEKNEINRDQSYFLALTSPISLVST